MEASPPALDDAFLQELEENATEFAAGAGGILLRYFKTALEVEYKSRGRRDPVTAADRESETYLRSAISDVYPAHSILGEEGKDLAARDADFLWVLDPLDGTTNFISGLPFFSVSVACLYRGEPAAAAIFVPTSGLLEEGVFHARQGGQTFLNGVPVAVADNSEPDPAQPASLPAHYWRRIRFSGNVRAAPGEVRTLGSIALELALTASGTLQYAVFDRPKIWDVAAGVLLVKQAGGLVLLQQGNRRPWLPLERFEAADLSAPSGGRRPVSEPADPLSELEGYRRWAGTIIAANPEVAWQVAGAFHRPSQVLRRVGHFVGRMRQLPLLRALAEREQPGT